MTEISVHTLSLQQKGIKFYQELAFELSFWKTKINSLDACSQEVYNLVGERVFQYKMTNTEVEMCIWCHKT